MGLLMINLSEGKTKAEKVFPYNYNVELLNNGLKVILIKMPVEGKIAYYTIVRTGSRDEYEPDHTGFAHFFEHMMFRGTKKYPGNVYDSLITLMGADANAYTTDDYTCFHLNFTKEDLEKVMELESDRFQNLSYAEPAFQTEAGAVYGEYRKGKTSPYFLLEERIAETAFTSHTYKHTTMGFEKDIAAMPMMYDYSKSFFKRYYRPENTIIVITGDVDFSDCTTLIVKYYGKWEKGYVTPQIQSEPDQNGERIAKVNYPGKTLPIATISYKADAFQPTNKSFVALDLMGELAFGENSDLYKKLYIKEQKIQGIFHDLQMNKDPNLFTISIIIKDEEDVLKIETEVYEKIAEFQSKLADKTQLDNLKKRLKYSFLMGLDTPDKVAGGLARILAVAGDMEALENYYKTIESISPQDILDAARKYLVQSKRTVVTLTGSK
jgi:zinc protease